MMSQTRTYLFALLTAFSLLLPQVVRAESITTEAQESDSIQMFRGLAVTYDLAGTIMRLVGDYGQIEGALRVNLRDRYFPIAELGWGTAKHERDIVTGIGAKVNAPYIRLGCDFNMSRNKHDLYRVLVGARYAVTSFKTKTEGTITDPAWGETTEYNIETPTCTYHWAELLFAVDAYIYEPLRLGWSFRYKMKLGHNDMGDNSLWYVPGFGKYGNRLGGTFNVTFELGRKNKRL